jgi:hypothetical protein
MAKGVSPFAKIHSRGERHTRSAVYTSSPLRSLRPCLGQDAPRRAWVGRVRSLAFLSILRGYYFLVPDVQALQVLLCRNDFPAAC